jgi:GNAT superfamily N-acetyltransferase
MTQLFSSADMALARRIEAGHAHSAMFSTPDLAVEEMAGGWAIFHAIDSPVTQAIGVGMNGPVESSDLDRLEAFYHVRGSAAIIDHCTLAHPSVLESIHERGYTVREISNVLVRRLNPEQQFEITPGVRVEPVSPQDYLAWARLVVQGFAGLDHVPEEQVAMMTSTIPWPETFFGFWDSAPGAGAAMDIHAGLATFFGDATLVPARGHGLQLALIRHRMQRAAQLGCDLATATVVPGGTSHRNYERAGFQLVYGRVMLSRPLPYPEPSSTKNSAEGQRQ